MHETAQATISRSALPRLVKGEHRILPRAEYYDFIAEDRERAEQRQALIEHLLAEREQIISETDELLTALGYVAAGASERSRANAPTPAQKVQPPCKVCGFKTSPPHDARGHRGQSMKQPFTAEELRLKNWDRVA
jgi:hypothetical protein